jgi:D-beta-D-heptose 7-phosphate kinase/D-beta-D-heptose 1-phosphate adenosyltransferase
LDSSLISLTQAFVGRRVLVLGDAMLDSYLAGTASALCREAPAPVISLTERADVPGGAANTSANVHALGGDVELLAVVGDDPEGVQLSRCLDERGISGAGLLVAPGRRTLAKHRVISAAQLVLRYDQGSTEPLDPLTERALLDRLAVALPRCEALIISDYCYGVLTPRVIGALAELLGRHPRVVVADSRRLAAYGGLNVTAVKPNYHEAIELLGLEREAGSRRAEQIAAHGQRLLAITGAQIAAVTLDSEGALVLQREQAPYRTYARPARQVYPAGAGDTFVATLALALVAGATTPAAADLASAAAAIVIGKAGTSVCAGEELRGAVSVEGKYLSGAEALAACAAFYRRQGRRVVFTNGCFDILHSGHTSYLSQAKALGDVLIVGVNTDAGVRRLKGPARPVNTLAERVSVLAALSCVDHLVAFDEPTPVGLIEALRPDVYVKGGDYTRETLPEASLMDTLGGEVHILPYLPDRSTTAIIERIRAAEQNASTEAEPISLSLRERAVEA